MKIIKSNISGETRVVVKGKGWIAFQKVNSGESIKTKAGWAKMNQSIQVDLLLQKLYRD